MHSYQASQWLFTCKIIQTIKRMVLSHSECRCSLMEKEPKLVQEVEEYWLNIVRLTYTYSRGCGRSLMDRGHLIAEYPEYLGGRGSSSKWKVGGSIPTQKLKQGTVPPCSVGAVIGCPPLQCMAPVSMSVWPCSCACLTGANLDGLKAEDKFHVCIFVHANKSDLISSLSPWVWCQKVHHLGTPLSYMWATTVKQ